VNMAKTGCRQREISQEGSCVAVDFRALAGLASPCPRSEILLYAWPHGILRDQLYRLPLCLGAIDCGLTGTLVVVMARECTAEVFRQRYHSTWRPWCREFVASEAIGRCSIAEVFEARCRLFFAVASASEDGGAVTNSTRERASATTLFCPEMCLMSVVNWAMKSRWLDFRSEHLSRFCWKANVRGLSRQYNHFIMLIAKPK
jgi:hypothetical protein